MIFILWLFFDNKNPKFVYNFFLSVWVIAVNADKLSIQHCLGGANSLFSDSVILEDVEKHAVWIIWIFF
jgi:hypothetical protein